MKTDRQAWINSPHLIEGRAFVVPDGQTMARWRATLPNALAQSWGELHSMLAHAPRAGVDFLDIGKLDPRQRIERAISICALALQDRPQLAARLRRIVPALAQEKIVRFGGDPSLARQVLGAVQNKSQPLPC